MRQIIFFLLYYKEKAMMRKRWMEEIGKNSDIYIKKGKKGKERDKRHEMEESCKGQGIKGER